MMKYIGLALLLVCGCGDGDGRQLRKWRGERKHIAKSKTAGYI